MHVCCSGWDKHIVLLRLGQKTLQLGPFPCRRSQLPQPPIELVAIAEAILGAEERSSTRWSSSPQVAGVIPPVAIAAATATACQSSSCRRRSGRGFGHLFWLGLGRSRVWMLFGPRLQVLGLPLLISARISNAATLNCLRFSGNSALTAAICSSDCIALNCVYLSCGAAQTL